MEGIVIAGEVRERRGLCPMFAVMACVVALLGIPTASVARDSPGTRGNPAPAEVLEPLTVGTGPVAAATSPESADPALDDALEALVAMDGGPPGAIAIVQRDSQVTVHTAGVADVQTARRIRARDHMRLASTSKAFSGAVALALVSQGQLALDDTIGTRLPDLPQAWSAVTLRQLLNHTSGLPDYLESEALLERIQADPLKPMPPEQLLVYVYDEPLRFTPGSRYQYSNSDNIAVGLMVEATTGRTYEHELWTQVFIPLKLTQTRLPVGARLPRPYLHGYDLQPPQPPEDVSEVLSSSFSWASGGMVSTPAELNRFVRGYVGGRLFGSDTQMEQRRFVEGGGSEPPGPGTNAAGLGIFRLAVFYGGTVVEAGAKEKIFAQPAHPYTEALLRAIPTLGHKVGRLHSIPGEPPNVARLPAGCPFHSRCDYVLEVCRSGAPPPVFTLPDARHVRCWLRENEHGGEPPRSA
jgi:D-alanyl-D-alanine carboxypeptidase